jgi:hypothetical protein
MGVRVDLDRAAGPKATTKVCRGYVCLGMVYSFVSG